MTYNVLASNYHNTVHMPINLLKELGLSSGGKLVVASADGTTVLKPVYTLTDRITYAENIIRRLPSSVAFINRGMDTICITREDGYPRVGTAHCMPDDRFSLSIGKAIAYLRAHDKPIPPILRG